MLAGQPALAEIPLRAGVEKLGAIGDTRMLATTHAMLARAMYVQGELDEAGELCRKAASAAADDDIVTEAMGRGARRRPDRRRSPRRPRRGDPHSYLRQWPTWKPGIEAVADDFTMLDLLAFVDKHDPSP